MNGGEDDRDDVASQDDEAVSEAAAEAMVVAALYACQKKKAKQVAEKRMVLSDGGRRLWLEEVGWKKANLGGRRPVCRRGSRFSQQSVLPSFCTYTSCM